MTFQISKPAPPPKPIIIKSSQSREQTESPPLPPPPSLEELNEIQKLPDINGVLESPKSKDRENNNTPAEPVSSLPPSPPAVAPKPTIIPEPGPKKSNGDLTSILTKKVTVQEVPAEIESVQLNQRNSLTTDASTNTLASSVSGGSTDDQPKKRTNFWGEERTVILNREPNDTFGISIVGGRVEVSQKGGLPGTGSTVSGIFIKSVMPNSPAGRSNKMFMGDRVISVSN